MLVGQLFSQPVTSASCPDNSSGFSDKPLAITCRLSTWSEAGVEAGVEVGAEEIEKRSKSSTFATASRGNLRQVSNLLRSGSLD